MKKFNLSSALVILIGFMFMLNGCQKNEEVFFDDAKKVKLGPESAKKESPEVATKWMQLVRTLVRSEGKNPPQASRIYAYMGVTMYEAMLPTMQENRSFAGKLNGLVNMPSYLKKKDYDGVTSINEAMKQVVRDAFGGTLQGANQMKVDSLYAAINATRAIYPPAAVAYGKDFGGKVATAIKQWMATDNFTQTRSMVYDLPSRLGHPEYWAPTSSTSPLEPFWGQLRSFVVSSPDICTIPMENAYSEDTASTFYKEAYLVYNTRNTLTTEQTAIARWWADGAVTTATPPGHWVSIANQMVAQKNMRLNRAVKMHALLGIAMADAFICCWDMKYKQNLLRPITYIREQINPTWSPLLTTPNFPEYTSGHSTSSGAAAEVLTQYLGTQSFLDSTNLNLGLTPRYFSSFEAAAQEASISRVYGGIHFREACTNGILMGRCVANQLKDRLDFEDED
jgi:hypothetical protein